MPNNQCLLLPFVAMILHFTQVAIGADESPEPGKGKNPSPLTSPSLSVPSGQPPVVTPPSITGATLDPKDDEGSEKTDDVSLSKTRADLKSAPPPSLAGLEISNQAQYMKFHPNLNNVEISKPTLRYSVDETEESDIEINNVVFNSHTFAPWLGPLKRGGRKSKEDAGPSGPVFFFTMPSAVAIDGELSLVGEDGNTVFSKKLDSASRADGEALTGSIPTSFWGDTDPLYQTQWAIDADTISPYFTGSQSKSGYRFCWKTGAGKNYAQYCTPFYRYSKSRRTIRIQTQTSSTKVYVNNNQTAAKNTLVLEKEKSAKFLATSKKGFSIEFHSPIPEFEIHDFYLSANGDWIHLAGSGDYVAYPLFKKIPYTKDGSFADTFKWQETIGDIRNKWFALMPKNKTELTIQSQDGGLFLFTLKIPKIPEFKSRISITKPLRATYLAKPQLIGAFDSSIDVSPDKDPKSETFRKNKQGTKFEWTFDAKSKGEDQEQSLNIKQKEDVFKASYGLYRGHNSEFSLRMAGIVNQQLQMSLLGEMSYNQWFETLFGWDNYYLGRQRWGLAARNFVPVGSFAPQGTTTNELTLKLATLDLKYRFTPGLWEHDETWGLILGYESVTINTLSGTFGGLGFFWARSMPRLFDQIMNWFPFMSYPKWVDMEVIYFNQSFDPTIKMGGTPTVAINFHGKILWKKNFFGEAGFGVKTYSYVKGEDLLTLQALYGTAGLGMNF